MNQCTDKVGCENAPENAFLKLIEGMRNDLPKFKNREEAYEYWEREAASLTEHERCQQMERDYRYYQKMCSIWSGYDPSRRIVKIDIYEAQVAIKNLADEMTAAANCLSRHDLDGALHHFNPGREKYVQLLALKTTFEVSVYRVDRKAEPPRNEDDLIEIDDCFVTSEYDDRNAFLEAYMALLTWGARESRKVSDIGLDHWIAAIRLLKDAADQKSGCGMKDETARQIVAATERAFDDLKLASHIKEDRAAGIPPTEVNKSFFIAEEGLMGISAFRLQDEAEGSAEEELWIKNHNGETIRNRIVIEYSTDTGLSLRDPELYSQTKGKRGNYSSLCKSRTRGALDSRFKAIVKLLRTLDSNPEDTCHSEDGEEWSKLFQKPKSDDKTGGRKETVYAFKIEQLIALKKSDKTYSGEWRFKLRSEM